MIQKGNFNENKEPYLTIHIVGHAPINVFKNHDRPNEKHPSFRSDGVAVWVNVRTLKPKVEEKTGEEMLEDVI